MSEASASCTGEGGGDYGPDYSAAPSQQTISVSLDSFARFEGRMGSSQDQDSSLALVFSPNSQFSSTPLSPSPHVDAGGSSYSTVGGTQQNTEQNSSLCSNSHLVNTTPAAARQEGMDVETLSSTPLPKDTYAAVKKASGQNPPRHETAKSRRTEEKPNAYSNQDNPPYAVHIHALVDNGASPPHPMKMFAQVGRVMPAADILEMKKLGNGQVLPSHVNLFWSRHEVRPYVPKARICYSCFRAGHVSASCRSTPRCLYCGKPPHSEGSVCPLKNSMPRCINCTGEHLPT
ncbi:PREDICTED: uncharacterized protein LOC105462095, partial [Wasmannia auropunctata]|uniref:uncharacterized protein LOC105462095 n=1 Tax=Wasmannia auropunctata TaxID=64793 RepID=UPI0005EE13F0